jgi:GxxExxY protein
VIIDACYQVFRELGHGFSEKIYRRALAIVLREKGLAVIEECEITVHFHGTLIGSFNAALVVAGTIIVEIKAAQELESRDEAQLLNYLKCAGGGVGLLVNFGNRVQHKRRVMGNPEANLPNLI